MKKKFGLFALVLAVLLCGSLFLLAACDETEEDPADTPATISVTVNGTAQTSGGTYSATVGTAYTFAATASNGNAVTISYVFGDAAAKELNGTSFTPTTAGSYVFTFTAEGATNFTLTLVAAEAEVPQSATISVTVNGTAQTSGGTYSATVGTAYTFAATASNGNAVTISYVFGDAEAEELNGTSFTPETAGSYAFTFTAEGATNFTLTLVATEAEVPPATQYTVTYKLGEHAATDAQEPTKQTVAENTQVTLPAAVAGAEGYTFGGWNDGTTTYQAGATYTVTDNVTMTAVWNVVHTHTYTWEVTTYPVESDGAATGTCSGCAEGTEGHTKTVTLPKVIGVDETGSNLIVGAVPDSGAQVGKYYVTVTNPTCTVDGSMAFFYVYDEKTVISFTYMVEGTALGHAYVVEYDSGKMTSDGWTATVTCDRSGCGATHEFTDVPAVNSEDTDNWSETSKIDYEGQMPTCTTDGKTALAYKNAAPDGGVLIVKNVPIPALGHAYEISYEDGSVKADCLKCDSVYSATVTIGGGEDATGNTVLAAENFAFNAETNVFTVTLPQNAFEKDGFTFSGWRVGGETYTEGQTVTVAANGSLEIVAQWTAVNVPQISLDVKVDGQYPIETTDGGNTTACVDTSIHYVAAVSEGQVTVSYTLNDGDAQPLPAEEDFTFDAAGTYEFLITAPGADDYTFTVNVKEHEWGAWGVTSEPSESALGQITRTCSVTNHTFSLSVPVLTEGNVTDSNEGGKYTVTVTKEATCTESGSATYIYNIPSEYGGGTIEAATVTLPQSEHSFTGAEATVDKATGNIIQTCTSCGTATNTLATLTGLSVGWAESAQGWYTVGGTINASDFDVTYTYEDDVAAYEDIIKAAITDNITQLSTAQTGLVTVTFTLGDTDASISVRIADGKAIDAGTVTANAYLDRVQQVGAYAGEFTLYYTVSDLTQGANIYNSWLITFVANDGAIAVLRADNYLINGWGQYLTDDYGEDLDPPDRLGTVVNKEDYFTGSGNILTSGNLDFVVSRAFVTDHYEITVTISNGTDTTTYTLAEPATNGVTMTVWFAGDTLGGSGSYNYSDVLYDLGTVPAVSGISATNVTVVSGTSLETALAGSTVTVSYDGVSLTDTFAATVCEVTNNGGYEAAVASTYTVTLSYGDVTTQVSVTVEAPQYSLLTTYAVDGESFTNGTNAVGNNENGTFANGGFKANAIDTVMVANPFIGQNVTQGITIHLEVYANSVGNLETPIVSLENTSNNAFLTITQVNGVIGVRYNDMSGNYIDGTVETSFPVATGAATSITVSVSVAGVVTVYVNGNAAAFTVNSSGGTLAQGCTAAITSSDFNSVMFFGGAMYWENLFDGYIQSCSFYNGIVPADDIAAL